MAITVDGLRQNKTKLEDEIKKLISAFEKENNVYCTALGLNHLTSSYEGHFCFEATVWVEIKI